MLSCAEFLEAFSDYRDDLMSPEECAAVEDHLAVCGSCTRYVKVYEAGVGQLRALPTIEPSEDFIPRLQHRIYHIDDERALLGRREGSGASTAFVVSLVALMAAAAWLPMARTELAVVELPPVAASPPRAEVPLPRLFRTGPLLTDERPGVALEPRHQTVLFRYSTLGSYASYRPGSLGLR